MSLEGRGDNSRNYGYSDFSLEEFKDPYSVEKLCEAIKRDNYGLKLESKDNSISRINEILERVDFYEKLIKKKGGRNWSLDIRVMIQATETFRNEEWSFSDLTGDLVKIQKLFKRLNRLLLEETYPEETPQSSKYFIPQGLLFDIKSFENHFKVAKGEPILIVGQTGVGKSLFIHIFEKLYREEHKNKRIVKANCAHFGGDPNLVRSELFGHEKGSFTGAVKEKKGLVEQADKGVLILEEIGDLPKETQAILLTFIETGEYYRVGDEYKKDGRPGPRKANVQIVGLTNRENNLRNDFAHRFFPFYIHPIHERRQDILYYFCSIFPDLIETMTKYEALTLLSYHWPGNVREIERVGRILRRDRENTELVSKSDSERASILAGRLSRSTASYRHSSIKTISAVKGPRLLSSLIERGIDVDSLEGILNNFNLGLSFDPEAKPVFNISDVKIFEAELSERYGLRYTFDSDGIENANEGLSVFCQLFCQHPMSNSDLFDLQGFSPYGRNDVDDLDKELGDKLLKLTDSLFEYSKEKYEEYLSNIREKTTYIDISSFRRDDLLKNYYFKILENTQGNQAKAAKIAGESYSTFRDHLIESGIDANIIKSIKTKFYKTDLEQE